MNIQSVFFKLVSVDIALSRCCHTSNSYNKHNLKKLLLGNKMPRNSKHIAEAQKQRIKIKEKAGRYIPGTVSLQVLGSGAPGSPASVYLFTDQSRYLFNCGEGTQRLAHEHKTKLSRLEHIFMTRTSWKRIGGIPGLSLTVQDAGVPSLTLHGPPGIDELFRAMRRFVILKELKVEAAACTAGAFYEDNVITVNYVPLFRKTQSGENSCNSRPTTPILDTTDYYAHETQGSSNGNTSPTPLNGDFSQRQDETLVMAYICRLKAKPGALSLEKCVDKGVPPGPLLGQLKNGNDIKLADGTIVYANEVRAPDDLGPVFCILDIPNEEYLESLIENQHLFKKYQANEESDSDHASIILHFTSKHIMDNPIYKSFMETFSDNTTHLILNGTNRFSGYLAAHRIQFQLNQLNEQMFPILKEHSDNSQKSWISNKKIKLDDDVCVQNNDNESENNKSKEREKYTRIELASSLTCYHLRPNKGLDRSTEPVLTPIEYIRESTIIPGFNESLDELKETFKQLCKNTENRIDDYPKIVFLGTGSCIPNKTRNVSSILVHISPDSCILLDCGEGTSAQLKRFYGIEKSDEIFHKLKAVYISHLHADHHIGLIGALQERSKLLGPSAPPLLLFAPAQISSWLQFYDRRIEPIANLYTLISNGDMLENALDTEQIQEMGLTSIKTCLVRHCPHSFGVALEITPVKKDKQFKLTYSGDTMPCDALIELGMNSTVLIHEATMEDELEHQAKIKMHSTVSQAIEQGTRMNAEYTLLTHFSQRYAKLPRIENELATNIGIAFDNMEVCESDLKHLHLLYPTLKLLFAEHCEEMEQKAIKRAFKQQRQDERVDCQV